jgi:hypothetical protein
MSSFVIDAPKEQIGEALPFADIMADLQRPRIDVASVYDLRLEQERWAFLENVPASVPDVHDVDYHQVRAWSKSMISNMKDSPAHMRYVIDHPQEATDAMIIGSATHTRVLESHKFDSLYAVRPDVKLNTNIGKAEYQRWVEEDPSRVTKKHLKPDDYRTINGIRDSVMAHPYASKLIEV